MVDLNSLRGFLPALGAIPTIVYFHENQFVYPERSKTDGAGNTGSKNLINAQITSIYSALCADRILFNSQYNRQTFIDGACALLKRMPDCVPLKEITQHITERAAVIPVPIAETGPHELHSTNSVKKTTCEKKIVWNHRWEYDKQPDVFFNAMRRLADSGVPFRLHVMGQSFRTVPACFGEAREALSGHIDTWGHQPAEEYYRVLATADIVVSTALHDFQGLSTLEAINCGCVPVAPRRVVYPEYLAQEFLYSVETGDEAGSLYLHLLNLLNHHALPEPPDVSSFSVAHCLDKYRALFESMDGR